MIPPLSYAVKVLSKLAGLLIFNIHGSTKKNTKITPQNELLCQNGVEGIINI